MTSAERQPITGVWRRTDPPPNPPLCENSSDLYQFQERPLAKVGWTCPPQSTPWRRHWSEYLGRRAQGYRGIACGVRRHGPQNRYANSSTNQSMSIRAHRTGARTARPIRPVRRYAVIGTRHVANLDVCRPRVIAQTRRHDALTTQQTQNFTYPDRETQNGGRWLAAWRSG